MPYLQTAGEYEKEIKRGVLSFRSKRLDALVEAIDKFIKTQRKSRLQDVLNKLDQWKREDPKEFADRGQRTEMALRWEIGGLLNGWGAGEIRIVDYASHPRWEPGRWNDNGEIQFSTNCYAYACNDPIRHDILGKPQPGQIAGKTVGMNDMEHSAVRYLVMRDDLFRNHMRMQRLVPLVRLRGEAVPECVVNVRGYYLIALVTAPGADYHWLRQDNDGMWSHKPGWGEATNLDSDDNPIYDPRDAALRVPVAMDQYGNVTRWADYEFSTFYYAPKGGVRTGDLGILRSRRGSI